MIDSDFAHARRLLYVTRNVQSVVKLVPLGSRWIAVGPARSPHATG
jgi:hypothetical protein